MRKKLNWIWEFSKKILTAESVCFFLEQIVFIVMIFLDKHPSDVMIQTSADVFTASVVAYCIKAGIENVTKIRKKERDDNEGCL